MCDWCPQTNTPEERERLKMAADSFANKLEAVAAHFRAMANGRRNPHEKTAKDVNLYAKAIIRELVHWF